MKIILPIAASGLVLAGCADVYHRSSEASACRPAADRSAALQVSGPGLVMSGGYVVPSRYLGGSGKLDIDWGNTPRCVRPEQDETNPSKSYDLQKVGIAL